MCLIYVCTCVIYACTDHSHTCKCMSLLCKFYNVTMCFLVLRFYHPLRLLYMAHKYAKCKSVANFIPQYIVDMDNFVVKIFHGLRNQRK